MSLSPLIIHYAPSDAQPDYFHSLEKFIPVTGESQ